MSYDKSNSSIEKLERVLESVDKSRGKPKVKRDRARGKIRHQGTTALDIQKKKFKSRSAEKNLIWINKRLTSDATSKVLFFPTTLSLLGPNQTYHWTHHEPTHWAGKNL